MNLEKLELEQIESSGSFKNFDGSTTRWQGLSQPNPKKKGKHRGTWSHLFNKKKLDKGFVAVLYLRNNRNAELLELKPKNGFFTIAGKTYHEQKDCIYTIAKERIPLVVIEEDQLFPRGTKSWLEKSIQQKFAEFQDHVLKAIRYAELVRAGGQEGPKINPKVVIGLILLAVVGYAVFTSM